MRPTLHELFIADDADAWKAIGFDTRSEAAQVGTTTLRFLSDPSAKGIVAWSFVGVEADDLDGVEHRSTDGPTPDDIAAGSDHPNGSALVDHVVVATPDMGRTEEEFGRVGLDLRRVREVPGTAPQRLQAFYRTGEVVLEVVGTAEPTGDGPSSLWGIVTVVRDIDAVADQLGDLLSTPKDAVQPGRRIATVRKEAGLSVPLAFITPDPRYHADLASRV